MQRRANPRNRQEHFSDFTASVLFCNTCKGPRPVRERLLLILPDGELHEYLCTSCGASLGSRRVSGEPPPLFVAG